jgi:uncharacterized membrane protein
MSHLRAFDIPLLSRVTVNVAALVAATVVAVVTGVVVGVLPAWQSPSDPNDALKEGTRGTTRGRQHARMRSALVVTEIAVAFVLVVASMPTLASTRNASRSCASIRGHGLKISHQLPFTTMTCCVACVPYLA